MNLFHILLKNGSQHKSFIFDKKIGIGPTIVTKFVEGHENKNYHFCFDNYYSTPYLFLYLNSNGIDFTCTFNKNRKNFPNILKIQIFQKTQKNILLFQILI